MSACLLARAKLAQYVGSLKPSLPSEKAVSLMKAGYLATVKGPVRNFVSNLVFGVGLDDLAMRPPAIVADVVLAHLKSAATFGKIAPHELRTLASSFDVGGAKARLHGVREGTAKAVELLRTGVDAERMAGKWNLDETNFETPALDAFAKGVGNVMEAGDKPFFGYAFQRSLYERAKLIGIRAGLAGDELRANTDRLLAAPTDEMTLGAVSDAEYATFKNRTALGQFANAGKRKLASLARDAETPGASRGYQVASTVAESVLPFTSVPSAIASATFDLTPGGALLRAALTKGNASQAIGKTAVSTALFAAGLAMANEGNVTTDAESPAERARWQAEGKTPYSVKFNGRWRSILFLGPGAPTFLLGAYIAKAREAKKIGGPTPSAGAVVASGATFVGKTLSEAAYLQNVRKTIDGIQSGGSKAEAMIGGFVPTPAIVGQLRTAVDPTRRDVDGFADRMKNATPGLSRTLPTKLDALGQPLPRREAGVRGVLETFLDPSNPSTDRSTPMLEELDRLKVSIPGVPKSVRGPTGQPVPLTAEQRRAFQGESGPRVQRTLQELTNSASFQALSDAGKARALASVLSSLRRAESERRRAAVAQRLRSR